jgi:hypothetical protein
MAERLQSYLEGSSQGGDVVVRKWLEVDEQSTLLLDRGITQPGLDIHDYSRNSEIWYELPASTGVVGEDDPRYCEPHLKLTFFIKGREADVNVVPPEAVFREVKIGGQTSIMEVSPNAEVTVLTPWAKVAKTVIKV